MTVTLQQGWQTQFLEGRSPVRFRCNPSETPELIKSFRLNWKLHSLCVVGAGLVQNSAGLQPSRNWVWHPCLTDYDYLSPSTQVKNLGDTSVCGALDALTPASVHSLWSSPKFLNRFFLTILISLRFSRLVVHLFPSTQLSVNMLGYSTLWTASLVMNVCVLPSLWRVSMIVFWTTVRSAVFPVIV